MATIVFDKVKHSYVAHPHEPTDYALQNVDFSWSDGGAYALLGPSGCGKTTLLNIISGLLTPSEGRILFDGRDVTKLSPNARRIAQVFQFPVVYDTMTVYQNLAFPLKNRGVDPYNIEKRVIEIANMLDLTAVLHDRASGLTADGKQKISLGRGLVRTDVNAILFDEPLTVIDPHLKWQLRSKLKQLHQQVNVTMIYVTHDQTEALTFADHVVVMHDGQMVQVGSPEELFTKPRNTFVGHFIGSPGMNLLPCDVGQDGRIIYDGHSIKSAHIEDLSKANGVIELGIRPEFVRFADQGIPVDIVGINDLGHRRIVELSYKSLSLKLILKKGETLPANQAYIDFKRDQTHIYGDGWIIN